MQSLTLSYHANASTNAMNYMQTPVQTPYQKIICRRHIKKLYANAISNKILY